MNHRWISIICVLIITVWFFGNNFTVNSQNLITIFHNVARNTDDTFDVIHLRLKWVIEHHDIASGNVADWNNDLIQNRQADTVREFVHQDKIAFNQARTHGAGRNLEWLGNKSCATQR